jgi:hypothetical protein
MMPVVEYLAVASFIFTCGQIGLAAFTTSRSLHYRRVAKFERIRGTFADARSQLLWLAAHDHIAVNSVTFRKLYAIQTEMVRDVNSYAALSQLIWIARLSKRKTENVFGKEPAHWAPEVKEVVIKTADGLHQVWTSCAPFMFMVKLAAGLTTTMGALYVNQLSKAAWAATKSWHHTLSLHQVRDVEVRLRRLAS